MKQRLSTVVLLLLMGALIAACAAPAAPAATGESSAAAPQTQVIELEFWTLLTGNLAEALDAQVQAFNASQDRIRIVNVNQGGYNELQQKLLASIAAGNMPPITMVDYIYVPYYAQQGVFAPIDELASPEDMADFIPALLEDLSYNGRPYALPYNRSTQGFYYNKDLFREVGLDPDQPPATWEEFREVAKILSESGVYGTYANYSRWYFEPFVYQWGGVLNDAECNPTLDSPEVIAMAKFFQDLYHVDGYAVMPATLSGTFDQAAIEFINGQVGMMRQSTAIQSFIGNSVDFDWGFAMMPAGPVTRAVTHGGGNVAISAFLDETRKAAAWEFVRFLTDTERSAEFHMATGYMPTRYSVLERDDVKAFHAEHPSWLISVQQLEFARPTACIVRNVPEYNAIITQAIDRMIINNEDPATVLGEVQRELQLAVDELRAAGTLIP